jgi:maltose alpha-D-glucosyltransferase / alpha-amylase
VTTGLPVLGAASLAEALEVGANGPARAALERDALPAFVGRQRWFSAKARTIVQVRVAAHGPVPHVGPAASDGIGRWVVFADLVYTDGPGDRYVLPLADVPAAAGAGLLERAPGAAIAWIDEAGARLLADGMEDDEMCRALLAIIRASGHLPLTTGTLVGTHTDGPSLEETRSIAALRVRRTGAEQSNSSVIFGTTSILKLFRRVETGPHPEIEVGRHLMRARFEAAPAVHGTLEYAEAGGDTAAVGVLHALVQSEGDGWAHALREVEAYFARLEAHPRFQAADGAAVEVGIGAVAPDLARELVGRYHEAAATLGRQTAEMHKALATALDDPAFACEPLEVADAQRVAESTRVRARRALAQLAERLNALPPTAAPRAQALIGAQPGLFERLDALEGMRIDAARTRVHQDFHLGQTLWTGRDYVILDFEGEPLRPLAERRVKRSPLTDVAGMLRSYSYAAWSGLFAWCRARGRDPQREAFWAAAWEGTVASAFLDAYRAATAGAPFVPADPAQFETWLRALMLEKAVYELEYELNNRPDWVLVPVEGLLRLL